MHALLLSIGALPRFTVLMASHTIHYVTSLPQTHNTETPRSDKRTEEGQLSLNSATSSIERIAPSGADSEAWYLLGWLSENSAPSQRTCHT